MNVNKAQVTDWQVGFEQLLPRITKYLKFAFRGVVCSATRADFISDGVALCWKWFCRATAKGKCVARFVSTLARFAVRAVRSGKSVCGKQRVRDVLSRTAKFQHGVAVERFGDGESHYEMLDQVVGRQRHWDFYDECLAENTVTPVPEQVVFRLDWPRFVGTLSSRDRKIMTFLAAGNSNRDAARKFKVSPGRVSQLRRQWCEQWAALCEC